MTWLDNFTNYTTGTAFNLSLSHDHVACLAAVKAGGVYGWRSRSGRSSFVPTVGGLIKRGLVEHNEAARIVGINTPGVKLKWIYRLTPAGELAVQMLVMAGVIDHAEIQPTAAGAA